MAIKAILQTLDGKREAEVVDPGYVLADVWPIGDCEFPLLRYLDPYGNTIFNGQQMNDLARELEVLLERASTDEQREILHQILNLATSCKKRPHWFLRFRGD